ncbi:Pre-mRNA splicing Prp18-interacting factor-domain-containing protein [Phyllosticta citriasiana]|uniref:Pre-mRNA splicing Prp18-interacting factor-domain-containing protein n=1 Tax=Phyllosticta citriasiana TaxID=595635 RepID=UPI0030FD3AA9
MPPAQPRKPAEPAKNERNEYIPSFIAKKPFYITDDAEDSSTSANDYLEHQRLHKSSLATDSKWYDRGRKAGPAATKFRKGACENCGAMSHKTKECLSRPRKAGARWTGKNIEADEVVQDVSLGWDAKRDRWNGYDPQEYMKVVEEYKEVEDMKKKLKGGNDAKPDEDEDEEGDEDAKYEAEADMGRKQPTSTRNLRIREDTAKYLVSLDLNSAEYNPKTRTMMDGGISADKTAQLVAEEGFMRASGDAAEFEKAQKLAWESQQRGDKNKVHLQANPTSGEYFRKKEAEEAEQKREAKRKELLEKYGGQEHLQSNPIKAAAVMENERYVEYDSKGRIKGAPVTTAKSKYPEDIHINNHTSVWGSWWSNFQWGYACCHSTVKNSYCTGEEGRRAFEEAERMRTGVDDEDEEVPREEAWKEERALEKHVPNAVDGDEKRKGPDDRNKKRPFEEIRDGITEEEMEEYRRKKVQAEDPMAKLLGKDELL